LIKNIIFDWSGTLSNDLIPVYNATMITFEKLGAKRISLEEYRREFELPYMNFYKKYIPNVNKEEQDKLFLGAIHSVEEPTPFPQANRILEYLLNKGIKMAILSSHPQTKIEKEINDYGFSKFFACVKGSVHDKTETISEIMRQYGFEPNETAYVGDMVHDIDAGKKANVTTVAVSWGYQPKEKLSIAGPDLIIDELDQLKKIIS
jgi:phosphoglycolate phosphatase